MMEHFHVSMMPKKSIYDSGTTKGSAPRTSNKKRYDDNWDRIFGKKDETPKESSGSVKHFADGFHEGRWEDD